jgi:phenylpropionate dioxygenase-like ring-hydroxylating dioxygenase large terminal subunit
MLTQTENNDLTRVGRGTPMGNFMRAFWIPACKSVELQVDANPMRLMLLGEKLIAFRDTEGRVGIFDHRCPHRCASFFFGRNEEGGIRCGYHGWKFDVTGKCLDQPNLPVANRHLSGNKATAYRTAERGGLVFVYMGNREVAPPLPDIEALFGPVSAEGIALTQRECNWLQNLEADLDTSHLGFLHMGKIDGHNIEESDPDRHTVINKSPSINARETPFGSMYSAQRSADEGEDHHRFACFIFPFYVTYPSGMVPECTSVNAWVPIDDDNTMIFNIDLYRGRRDSNMRYKDGTTVPGLARPLEYLPQTTDWQGRWRSAKNVSNDFGRTREAMMAGSYIGVSGIPLQDQAITESMGQIVDRSMEHLATSDRMLVLTRRLLLRSIKEYAASGKLPAVLDDPALSREARGGDIVCAADTDWIVAYEKALDEAVTHEGRPLRSPS